MVRTVEHSQVGEGLRTQKDDMGEEVVVFDDPNTHSAPYTADNGFTGVARQSDGGQFTEFDQERPTRDRRKKFDRYGGYDSPERSMNNSVNLGYGGDSGRFDSLILAKRIKNENSRMLQSLETRFSIL